MPHRLAVVAALSASLLLLAACGGDDPSEADGDTATPTATTSEAGSAGGLPTVDGGFGETPTVSIPAASPPAGLKVKVLEKGDGATVAQGELVVVDYQGQTWDDGNVFDSSFDRSPLAVPIGIGNLIPGWDKSLVGKKVGSRLLLVIPPADGYGEAGNADAGISGDDTLVFVVDVRDAFARNASAQGAPTPTEDDALPAVSVKPRKPTIDIPPGKAPPDLVVVPVVTGDGEQVKSGDLLVVQYVGQIWKTGKEFDSSWSRGTPAAFGIGVGSVIPGWDQGLVGQAVGSRVLLVIPPEDGYGSGGQPQAGIKGTDTLVFAVDILGSYR